MKSMFHEWVGASGRLDFCPTTFPNIPEPKRPRTLTSRLAHPHAPANLKQTPYLKAQRAVFGASAEREFTFAKANGVKVDGLKEMFGL